MSELKKFPVGFFGVRKRGALSQEAASYFEFMKNSDYQTSEWNRNKIYIPERVQIESFAYNLNSTCKQGLLTLHSQLKGKYTFLSPLVCVSKVPATQL